MDSYQIFIERLQQDVVRRNFINLTETLKDGPKYFEIISSEHYESIVCSVFDKRKGLLYFLDYELQNFFQTTSRSIALHNVLKEAFSFLQFFIGNFYTIPCFVQYIKEIKAVCQLAQKNKYPLDIKKPACNAFIKLIKFFREHDDLILIKTIQLFVGIFPISNAKERRWMLRILGKIIKYRGDICASSHRCLDTIFQQLYSDASQEYKIYNIQKKDQNHRLSDDFSVYLNVFTNILGSIRSPDQIREKLFHLYKWIKDICRPNEQSRIKVRKAAIKLLNSHMNQFQDLLYLECRYWCDTLWQLLQIIIYKQNYIRSALETFYQIIGQMLLDQNRENSENIVLYFFEDFQRRFRNADSNLITLQLSIYGFSQLAALFKMYSCNFDVKQMYSNIARCALSITSSEQSDETQIQEACYYQNALSEMNHMSDMTIEKINSLVKLSIYIIKKFPDLKISSNMIVVSSLIKTISNLEPKILLQQYLNNIVRDSIEWSCSHMLALDAELQRDLNQPLTICYKNYLPLWIELLNTEKYPMDKQQLAQQVADTLMNVCITLINRLNVRIKRTNEIVLSNIAFTHSAENQTDFRIFVNLVDLYTDIINASELSLFANTVHKFLYNIVKLSCKHPLIPGFYKLVRVGMRILAYISEEENEKEEEEQDHTRGQLQQTEKLLSNYLIQILDLIPTFSNELLIACLHLILDARLAYIEDALSRTLPIFKIAFTIGLSNLELAYAALVTLETWTRKREGTDELLRGIVSYLEPYLRSTESSVEISQDLTKAVTRKRVKRVGVIDTECTLRNFQRRILLFLGSLDNDLLLSFVHERASRSTGASWDHKDLIKYGLPLPDVQPNIYFDRMLPRVIALARDSSDRRTKIAACEVLHSLVIIVIARTARHLSDIENRFIILYDVLCPTLLVLGCDSDEVVCGIFRPLTLQLMRWSARITMQIKWNMGEHIVNSLFDGLINDSNPALREFSGTCLAELTDWLIREARREDEIETQFNMIVQRINDLALHPSIHKRVAAAIAFNHLYVILSKDDNMISTYWLEMFYCFVRSLDGCDDLSIVNALTYIEKVMKCKADILNKEAMPDNRRKPHEFDGATLIHALYWLLSQCGSVDEHCRAKRMELYINISQGIAGFAQETTRTFVETYGIDRLNDVILRGLESNVDISVTSNVKSLLKALDCYVWLLEKQLLSVEQLFPATQDLSEHVIFSCIHSFVDQLWQLIKDGTVEATIMSRKFEHLPTKLQCKTLMTVFNFLRELLDINVNILPELLWDNALSALTIKCIMHPRAVGFDIKNIEMMDKVPRVLENLLKSMKLRCAILPIIFTTHLSKSIQSYVPELLNLHDLAQNNSCDELIQHVNGMIMLARCDILNISFLEKNVLANRESTVEQIFKFLVNKRIGEWICTDLSDSMLEYLRALMEFQLSQYEVSILISEETRSMTETLVRLISDDTQVIDMDFAKITHGEHFLNTFRSEIYRYMLIHMDAIIFVFDPMSRDNPSFLLKWIEDMLLFLKQYKHELQDYVDGTMDAILRQFTCLENAVGNVDSRKEKLMNIYGTAVHLMSKPTEIDQVSPEFYQRILDQLTGDDDIEFKTQILQKFFVCLINTDGGRERPELRTILRPLRKDARFLCSNLLSKTDVNSIKVINCFETLLELLSTSRSLVTLECVMHFAVGYGDRLFNEKLQKHLCKYYQKASTDHVLQSLEMTYRKFMKVETGTVETERLELLRGFLLPTFEFCDVDTIEHFFEQNIRELRMILIDSYDNDADLKQTIVSKIGCFQLITIMFAKIDVDKIIGANSTIAQKALNQEQSGTEFFKSLLNITKDTRAVKIMRPECNELMRLLHCSAYNCSLAITKAKNNECYYPWAFGENITQGFIIWKNIIDCKKRYNFDPVFREDVKTREITVNIKNTVNKNEQRTPGHTYSYNLSGSTLNEDINAYDFNKCVPCSLAIENSEACITASIALESGDFNEHECMPYICVFLQHVSKNSDLNIEPKWLQFFCYALTEYSQPNIRLFLLKIISNIDEVFKPYAKFVLMPIIKAIINYLQQYNLNYIVIDILEMLLNWHDMVLPNSNDDRVEAQRFFEIFLDTVVKEVVENRGNHDTNNVHKHSLQIIEKIIEKWHSCLRVPISVLNRNIMSTPKIAVPLIVMLLENNMAEEIVAQNDIIDFVVDLLRDWKTPNKELSHNCRCLGLFLKSLDNKGGNEVERENRGRNVKDKIFAILGTIKPYQSIAKQVKCIAFLCQTYPQIAKEYINIVISAMAKDVERSYCLEIFELSMQEFNAQELVDNLHRLELQSVLTKRIPEATALKIVRSAVTIILPVDLLPYVNLAVSYVKDSHREHRELVYDILMKVYERYSADTADDVANVRTLLSISRQHLISGLLDPSQDLQEKILTFWAKEKDLCTKEKSEEFLFALLKILSPQTMTATISEDAIASFIALLMLHPATRSTKKIFGSPLYNNCTFRDYDISVSWQRQNLSYMTPMFVNSLASQINYSLTFSQSVDNSLNSTYAAASSYLQSLQNASRSTQKLQSESVDDNTMMDTTFGTSLPDAEFGPTTTFLQNRQSTLSRRRRFRRSEANSSDANRHRQIQKNVQQKEMMKQENVRQRNSIKLYRNYRIGDFPDVEIYHSSLIKPLLQLIKLDRLICKDMTVSLFCSLLKETKEAKSSLFHQMIVIDLKQILHKSDEKNRSFNTIILETLLQLNMTDCNPQHIVKVSKANNLTVIGALFLEQSLLPLNDDDRNDVSSSKRMRKHDDINEQLAKWTQLASLYKTLNNVDVVSSIFRERSFFSEDVQEAALSEVHGNWIQMKDAFTRAYEQPNMISSGGSGQDLVKEYCLQGRFEAVNNLCDWSTIDQLVKKHANGSLNNIWDDAWRDWMLPYVCDAYVHMWVENSWSSRNNDLEVIQSWMRDPKKLEHLKPMLGEDLVMFLLRNQNAEALKDTAELLNDLLDNAGKQWVDLNPLCTELVIRKLHKLQAMNDLDALLRVFRCTKETDYLAGMTTLLDFWSTKVPRARDNLMYWRKLADYRTKSAELFERRLHNAAMLQDEQQKLDAIRDRMRRINIQLRLDIADAALHQKHLYIAENHLKCLKSIRSISDANLKAQVALLEAKIECLRADTEANKRISNYIASWKRSHRLLNENNNLDINMNIAIKKHIGTLALKIESLLQKCRENQEFVSTLTSNSMILRDIGITTRVDLNRIKEQLLQYSLNNLFFCEHAAPNAATDIGEHYYALAKHCYAKLTSIDVQSEIFQKFLKFTLRSMYHDYLDATHYFPCLLRPEQLQNEQTRQIFAQECDKLQPWLFLRWRDLLFSHLTTPSIATIIAPIVEKLADAYPDAVVYTYYLTLERNPNISRDISTLIHLHDKALHDKAAEYERFLQAIQYVVQPELYLEHYLHKAAKELSLGNVTAVKSLLQKMYSIFNIQATSKSSPRPGDIYKKLPVTYNTQLQIIDESFMLDRDAAQKRIQKLRDLLNKSLQRTEDNRNKNKNTLKYYSPFLHEYAGGNIEVPGQYSGDRKPIPHYHAKIARFETNVIVMQSLRKPIRIGIIGHNGKEYKFLVKFGEDLTIDHGLQQLYTTMNRTLRNDTSCRQRRLIIDTYEVIPLSRSFGLIQWIEDTRSLKDLIQFTLSDKEKEQCQIILNKYIEWIANAAPSREQQPTESVKSPHQYKKAAAKYSQSMVTNMMKRFISKTPQKALRKAFATLSPTWECFVTLQRNFVTSYATMCVAHWLAGVGDRHLQNILVCVSTGRCLGIDFGHAFGSGVCAPIPELVPFRLTPQILELLQPFTERDLLATIMTHAMRALREDCGPILACMDIFIHKPVRRSFSDNNNEDIDDNKDIDADSTWSSKKNIVAKKLNGIHPSHITLEQLKETHNNEYLPRYHAIVTGNDGFKEARASKVNFDLTPAEQVDCLLDQAKDLNVLGRMYAYWQPWL